MIIHKWTVSWLWLRDTSEEITQLHMLRSVSLQQARNYASYVQGNLEVDNDTRKCGDS